MSEAQANANANAKAQVQGQADEDQDESAWNVTRRVEKLSARNEPFFSFEYYPPKSDKGVLALHDRLHQMASWNPQWMDITWGAGGSTSSLTQSITEFIQCEVKMPCLMHLTCTNMEESKIDIALDFCQSKGVRNIMALRGDPPKGQKEWKAIEGGFTCARDLIEYIVSKYGTYFNIACAGYSEGHPNVRNKIEDYDQVKDTIVDMARQQPAESSTSSCSNLDGKKQYWAIRKCVDAKSKQVSYEASTYADLLKEIAYLKSKVDSGATLIVTQLFYDTEIFVAWVRECRKAGIKVPIMPGIMPVRTYSLFNRMTGFCKTVIPPALRSALDNAKGDAHEVIRVGMEWVQNMCDSLMASRLVPGVHIYTMNTTYTPALILKHLGLGNADKLQEAIQAENDKRTEERDVKAIIARKAQKAELVSMASF